MISVEEGLTTAVEFASKTPGTYVFPNACGRFAAL